MPTGMQIFAAYTIAFIIAIILGVSYTHNKKDDDIRVIGTGNKEDIEDNIRIVHK